MNTHLYVSPLDLESYLIHVSFFALAARKPKTKFYIQLLIIPHLQYLCLYLPFAFYTVQVGFDLIGPRVVS